MQNLTHELLQQSFDLMDDYVFIKDLQGRYTFANKMVCELFNHSLEEIVGKDDTYFFDLNTSNDILENDAEVLVHEKVIEKVETNVIKETNETKYYKTVKKPLYDENNKVIGLFGISTDITQEKITREKLHEQEALLRMVIDENPSVILVKNYAGKFLLVNKAVANLYQSNTEDMIGKDDGDYIPKDKADFFKHNIQKIIDEGKTQIVYEDSVDVKTGEIRHFKSIKKPMKDTHGNDQILVIATDITNEKIQLDQIEEQHKQLQESQERFKTAAECISDLIYEWDVSTDTLTWYGDIDSFLGYKKGEISQNIDAWLAIIHPDDIVKLSNAVEEHRISTEQINYEYRIKQKNGEYQYWIDRALPILDENNKPTKWVGTCSNITDSVKAERVMIEQSKMVSMGEMIGNIAHQWRQPLSAISVGATGLKLQKEYNTLTDELFIETCDAINNNAQYLSKTIDDFTDFIKGERKIVEFKLSDSIESFLHLVEGAIKSNNINIIKNIDENITIDGYPNELIQCFINIFNNSKDALNYKEIDDKLFFISTLLKENKIVISFKDNGGGIADDILPHIFEPYFTTKHQSQGTGLGLSMTYNLITEGMQGTIEAENESYNYKGEEFTGVQFIITLPLS